MSTANVTPPADCREWQAVYRQFVAKKRVDRVLSGAARTPVSGASVAERIRLLREEAGMTKTQLAIAVGKSYRHIQKWEMGEIEPDARSAQRLMQVFDVTLDEILGALEGQVPFDSWQEFLATPQGKSMTREERAALQMFNWPASKRPTVGNYVDLLRALRAAEDRPPT
jgi:transcriptional regulator with XRE-family HTH domain